MEQDDFDSVFIGCLHEKQDGIKNVMGQFLSQIYGKNQTGQFLGAKYYESTFQKWRLQI